MHTFWSLHATDTTLCNDPPCVISYYASGPLPLSELATRSTGCGAGYAETVTEHPSYWTEILLRTDIIRRRSARSRTDYYRILRVLFYSGEASEGRLHVRRGRW